MQQAHATINNVTPAVDPLGGATVVAGNLNRRTVSFVDPGLDSWTYTVHYGDGTIVGPTSTAGAWSTPSSW